LSNANFKTNTLHMYARYVEDDFLLLHNLRNHHPTTTKYDSYTLWTRKIISG